MGGDGGTVATQRSYLRAANLHGRTKKQLESAESRQELMKTCALTGSALNHQQTDATSQSIVACPYGRIYLKEEAVLALMRRRNAGDGEGAGDVAELGGHIRGLKDLYDVRFAPGCTCPITGLELGSGSQPCFVIVPNKSKNKSKGKGKSAGDAGDGIKCSYNVIGEKAIKQMGIDALQEEYGPFEERNLVRLAPPVDMMVKIKEDLENRRREEKMIKGDKKSKRKGHSAVNGIDDAKKMKKTDVTKKSSIITNQHNNTATSIARATVASAVDKDSVLSSLFVKESTLTEKEKKDKLMMTNGR